GIGWIDAVAAARAADHLVEVDYPVQSRFRTNPIVDLVTDPRFGVVPPRILLDGSDVVPRDDRDANNFDALSLDAIHDVLNSNHHLIGANFPANVVRTHKQYDVADAGMRQHVALETVHSRRTVGIRHQMRAGDGIAANSLIDDRPWNRAQHRETLGNDIFPPVMAIQRG